MRILRHEETGSTGTVQRDSRNQLLATVITRVLSAFVQLVYQLQYDTDAPVPEDLADSGQKARVCLPLREGFEILLIESTVLANAN